MKTKKLVKKLVLGKTTVADLNKEAMHALHGGFNETGFTDCRSRCATLECCETILKTCI